MNDLKFAFRQLLKNPGFTVHPSQCCRPGRVPFLRRYSERLGHLQLCCYAGRAVAMLILALGLAGSNVAYGHPGVGIVRDSRGNVFYTDLAQVWRLAPDGSKSIAVTNVHTHELCLDAEDNLYGEHLWYEGVTTKKWGHYVWRRSPNGEVQKIIPPAEGFLTHYSFVRDRAGNMYWADRQTPGGPAIRKRSPSGATTTVLQNASFRDIGFMTCSPGGTIYLIDRSDLIRIGPDNRMQVVAERLSGDRFKFNQRHKVQGLCASDDDNVWVAVSEARVVKRISKDGKVTVVAQSPAPFRPNGVLAMPDGHVWILEDSLPGRARVREIAPDGTDRRY
ncbi:MAG: hypothetical protein L0Z50_32810 [Verrucomicrobiales bacterium]|nr:hypothetical protein [Verrucomicrobiales bacterium]